MSDTLTAIPYARRVGGTTPSGPATVWFDGCTFTFLAEAADTAGTMSVLEIVARRGCEPPPHTHLRGDQAFLVVEGHATFTCGGSVLDAPQGTFVYLPRGLPHGFEILTETARFIVIDTPPGNEDVFRRFSDPAVHTGLPPVPTEPPNEERIAAMIAAEAAHGIVYAGA
jgi:quercetin dioxygenase-like cupin family protein